MTLQIGPHNRGSCPFYVIPTDPLSAEPSINKCISCACGSNTHLRSQNEDLRQIAYLTILEETPNYDPDHPSGATYTTFIKAKVCTRLWKEKRKLLREIPYSHQECLQDENENENNPLVDGLIAQACAVENMADDVIQQIEAEFLRKHLPKLLDKLSKQEKRVIEMKFFEHAKGVEIAQTLNLSEGYVAKLTKRGLAKLGKAYLTIIETTKGNPYRHHN